MYNQRKFALINVFKMNEICVRYEFLSILQLVLRKSYVIVKTECN